MRKLNPRAEKRAVNEAFALRFIREKKKGSRRKLRHERVVARETAVLIALGVDPTESKAPVA